jgi:hypothetical protein
MLIVFLPEQIDVFENQPLHVPHHVRSNTAIPRQAHRIEPELAFAIRTTNVDMGRLRALV